MAKLMTARRADTCCDPACDSTAIQAGTQINYGGPGAVTHAACKAMEAAPRTYRNRYSAPGTRYRGRCEDAPCCGCCD